MLPSRIALNSCALAVLLVGFVASASAAASRLATIT